MLVLAEDGQLLDLVTPAEVDPGRVERFSGTITPGFVNAHCHLELSHLKGCIAEHTGLPAFGRQVIVKRDELSAGEKLEHMRAADRQMLNNGIVAVGDISNGTESFGVKADSRIVYHSFIELIGLRPEHAPAILEHGKTLLAEARKRGLRSSLAPHAPYSTSAQLVKLIADFDEREHLPFSLHNQESEEETKFFNGQASGFHELYAFLNLDVSWFVPPGVSSLKHLAGELGKGTVLLVHNTQTRNDDLRDVAGKNIFWCFCPCANLYIENKLPEFPVFSDEANRMVLGTDSLASNHQLDLLAEANVILQQTAVFTEPDLLRAITSNAAKALGLQEQFGSFIKNTRPGLNLLQREDRQFRFIQKIA